MSLKDELLQDMKTAMKTKDKVALATIRMARSSIRNYEIDNKCELDDAGVGSVIAKEMKQRKESLIDFEKGGRQDLVDQTKAEMAVLEKYMPKQLSADEIRNIVTTAVAGMDHPKMGDIMHAVMPQVKGKADGRLVSQIVKEILQK